MTQTQPILRLAIDTQPAQAIKHMQVITGPQPVAYQLGEPNTLLCVCADGQMLACRYMTTNELLNLMREQRLLPAMLELRERSQWAYLLLSGQLTPTSSGKTMTNGSPSGYAWAATQGALVSIQEAGVQIVSLQSDRHLYDAIYTLAKRERTAKRVRPPREALFVSAAEDMLLALPGIGDERCAELLRYCGTGANALEALTHPSLSVPGIGPGIKRQVRQALGLEDNVRLTTITMAEEEAIYSLEDNHERNSPINSLGAAAEPALAGA